jgi:hypothetical protein
MNRNPPDGRRRPLHGWRRNASPVRLGQRSVPNVPSGSDRCAKGDTVPQGPPISTQLTTVCVIEEGNSARLGIGAECSGHTQLQVCAPAS